MSKIFTLVLDLIEKGYNPAKISKELNLTKQALNYYLRTLKAKGYIQKIGYGVWERSKNDTLYGNSTHRGIRSHGYRFKLKIKQLKNWDKREQYLQSKSILYEKLKGLGNKIKINIDGYSVWLNKDSILVIFPKHKSYFNESAKEGDGYAVLDFIRIIKRLEGILNVNLTINGKYQFKPFMQHHSLIKNELAKIYHKNKEKLFVYDEKGLWLLVDNSFNLHELELVSPEKATKDTDDVIKPFFNGLREMPTTPQDIWKAIGSVTENQVMFAKNIEEHMNVLKDMRKTLKEIRDGLK